MVVFVDVASETNLRSEDVTWVGLCELLRILLLTFHLSYTYVKLQLHLMANGLLIAKIFKVNVRIMVSHKMH